MSIQKQISLLIAVLVLIPMLGLAFFSGRSVSNRLTEQARSEMSTIVESEMEKIEIQANKEATVMDAVAGQRAVRELLDAYGKGIADAAMAEGVNYAWMNTLQNSAIVNIYSWLLQTVIL